MNPPRCVEGNRRIAIVDDWELAAAPAGSSIDDSATWQWLPARVPGTAAAALSAAQQWDFESTRWLDAEDFWWRTQIDAAAGAAVLGFDGLATLADVWLDRSLILSSNNMFVAHEVPVLLHGKHELLIRCRALAPELARKRARPRWRVPMLEQQQLRWFRTSLLGRTPGWSPPCPPIGPWRSIWLEERRFTVGDIELRSELTHSGDIDTGIVAIAATLDEATIRAEVIVTRGSERVVAPLALEQGRWRGHAALVAPALWWPHTHGEPALYEVALELGHARGRTRIELGRTGFRRIEIDRGAGDDFSVIVNGVPVFCRGACWTPLDVVGFAANAEACQEAIAQVRSAGMNMIRILGTMVYEDDALLDALDAHGILLWQDLMFANMDYPDDDAFVTGVMLEVDQQLARLAGRPCVALVCGNSEVEQQAAMGSAERERWSPPLFHGVIAERVRARGFFYVPSSAHGGAFPHAANHGPSSYYGVGAYRRALEDARRAEVRFASECLAFANIPFDSGLPRGTASRVHDALWKARSPRDTGAGWDFDDVRDYYMQLLFRVDPVALRSCDHERYLELGRATSGEVMAQVFGEWRRARSPTRGGLILFLRDLWPGAGWGIIDAHGNPKPCFHPLRRALAPIALALSDEGVNGLAIHIVNDRGAVLTARIELTLYRDGDIVIGRAARDIIVEAHAAIELAACAMFDGFIDLAYAYRFGPPGIDIVHAALLVGDSLVAEAHAFPAGMPNTRERDVGLHASVAPGPEEGEQCVTLCAARFAQSVLVEAPGYSADDAYFHLVPGRTRVLRLRRDPRRGKAKHGTVRALNSEVAARFVLGD